MTIRLSSGSLVEAAVTLAAAVLLTFAGFEMVAEAGVTMPAAVVAAPHVDANSG